MNIAIITPSLANGGAERIAGLLSLELATKDNVFIMTVENVEAVYPYAGNLIKVWQIMERDHISYVEALSLLKKKNNIDASISFMEIHNFANICSRENDVVIISERAAQSRFSPRLITQDYKIGKYYNLADAIVACSEGVKYDLVNEFNVDITRIFTIYNFIDKDTIAENKNFPIDIETEAWLGESEYFINVGRFRQQKNHGRLLRQFSEFKKKNKDIKLIIKGNGPLKADIEKTIELYDLENDVRIVAYDENPHKYIKQAKAFILSSYFEGLPNVILEAMEVGVPIISTDCMAGPRELLDDICDYDKSLENMHIGKRGILVANAESEDDASTTYMASAMEWIIKHEYEAKGMVSSQKKYMDEYRNEGLIQQWNNIIFGAIKRGIYPFQIEQEWLYSAKYIYIYGAGKIGKDVYANIKFLVRIDAFVVTKKEQNPEKIENIPVIGIEDVINDQSNVFFMAVGDSYRDEVVNEITRRKYNKIIFMEDWVWEKYLKNLKK